MLSLSFFLSTTFGCEFHILTFTFGEATRTHSNSPNNGPKNEEKEAKSSKACIKSDPRKNNKREQKKKNTIHGIYMAIPNGTAR